ncbi:peptidoglycan DD-metalloendopeptidase family protein [Paraflavitalea sp. CAU 1676]|uniref:peptidoglycan DD-metalloendopeptidase family protein n=1 Tax=Paraflavitalea sp. CAU 1676 TaxID=3032598 RepID=UPI0023DBA2D9|nr:peptidoglycan DD-metalloendopeptidase family protein [Paraflavitalea sp. CAU 1676]MDF2187372.1 peptidoglycan DD-metalloendopeptidase family protein [Paraflavitalea sp. CAU 1676]
MPSAFENTIRKYQSGFHPVMAINKDKDHLLHLDFTEENKELTAAVIDDTQRFSAYIEHKIASAGCRYGIGGYDENRTVYSRSAHFSGQPGEEPRRLHLGIDVWGPSGTPVYAFMGGMVHSYAFNDQFGDYGATLILLHQLDGMPFYTLYGHVSLPDIQKVSTGQYVSIGQEIAHFGKPEENGHWPPHLHFQIILDMELKEGDYPGVCKYSEREKYLANCPDPDLILQLMRYAK